MVTSCVCCRFVLGLRSRKVIGWRVKFVFFSSIAALSWMFNVCVLTYGCTRTKDVLQNSFMRAHSCIAQKNVWPSHIFKSFFYGICRKLCVSTVTSPLKVKFLGRSGAH